MNFVRIMLDKLAEDVLVDRLIKKALSPAEASRLATRFMRTVPIGRVKKALQRAGFGHVEASQILRRIQERTGIPVGLKKRERGIFARAARKMREMT